MKKSEIEFLSFFEQVKNSANETQKKERFISLLERWFANNEGILKIVNKLTGGAEQHLKIKQEQKNASRFADTQYENIIIEFENNLQRTEEHAKIQLLEQVSSFYLSKNIINFKLISTDTTKWIVYYLDIAEAGNDPKNWSISNLKVKEIFNVREDSWEDFYYFISKHLFKSVDKKPTLKNFLDDFGIKSNLYANSFQELMNIYFSVEDQPSVQICIDEWKRYLSIAYNIEIDSTQTFITHTYISIFVKILSYRVLTKDPFVDPNELQKILDGTIFYQLGVNNLTEKDFFSWCSTKQNVKKIKNLSSNITAEINNYNFNEINEDILKGIYQEFMDTDSKKALGEYYTPDWLCEDIINKLNIKKQSKIIDPSCGSGSFLRAAANQLKKLNLNAEGITKQIYGLDIHPLSVLISKTTILLSIKDNLGDISEPLTLNIYMTNTLLPPFEETLEGQIFDLRINEKKYNLNAQIFDNFELFNYGLDYCNKLAKLHENNKSIKFSEFEKAFKKFMKSKSIELNTNKLLSFYNIYDGLLNAKNLNRNSIWKFIISNLYRPYFFKNQFDFVIGNPPWFPYRSIKNDQYKEDIKKVGKNYNFLPKDNKNLTHLEIAAIFIAHSFENYLNKNSKLAFVLPRSFFQGSQHENTRNQSFKNMNISEIWDLKNVKPLFKTLSCVLFFDNKFLDNKKQNWDGREYIAKLPKMDINLLDAKNHLKIIKKKFYLSKLQDDTAITNKKPNIINKPNYYFNKFVQGATIVPRNFYFFDYNQQIPNNKKVKKINIKTSEEINKNAKNPWKDKKIEGLVSSNIVFNTFLANSILPFCTVNSYQVVLPLKKTKDKNLEMISSKELENDGDLDSSAWFKTAEKLWKKFGKTKNLTLYDRLNYQNTLINQNTNTRFVVLYTSSSKDVNASMYDRNSEDLELIVESKNYFYCTNSHDEALYLTAFLNSIYANNIIKDFQTMGDFGPRDIHRRILKLPLDKFNTKNPDHIKISNLAQKCKTKAEEIIKKYKIKNLKPNELGKIRLDIRSGIKIELTQIDKIFTSLF